MPQDFAGVMREFKQHQLHSGSKHGKKVTNPKQAFAIGFSEQRKMGIEDRPSFKGLKTRK
jgi:hypothetical protein